MFIVKPQETQKQNSLSKKLRKLEELLEKYFRIDPIQPKIFHEILKFLNSFKIKWTF